MQRGEERKEIALIFALYEITRTIWTGNEDMDEDAIGGVLLEEAEEFLERTVRTVLVKFRQIVLNTPRLCARFYYMLPEYRHLFHIAELNTVECSPVRAKAATGQLSLF